MSLKPLYKLKSYEPFFYHKDNELYQFVENVDKAYTPLNISVGNFEPFERKTDQDNIKNLSTK